MGEGADTFVGTVTSTSGVWTPPVRHSLLTRLGLPLGFAHRAILPRSQVDSADITEQAGAPGPGSSASSRVAGVLGGRRPAEPIGSPHAALWRAPDLVAPEDLDAAR